MKVIMSYPIGNQKQYLLWSTYDDEEAELNRNKIHEFKACDCFIDWIIHFRSENKNCLFRRKYNRLFFMKFQLKKLCVIYFVCLVKLLSFVAEMLLILVLLVL